jgi:hypothetical protein
MKGLTRSSTTLAGVAAAGVLIWFVPHYNRWAAGGYWAGMATFVLAGLVLGAAQLRSREGKGQASFLLVFGPVLVVAGWVMLAAQPRNNWFRHHAVSWSGDIGLRHVVHNLGEHVAVLAFALGLVFGLSFELAMIPKRKKKVLVMTAPAWSPAPAAEPDTAAVFSAEPVPADATEGDPTTDQPGRPGS